ncbi:MAG: AbrB/MazE/SpoVT family DNA-binding domain-containing protein [Elusimicrobia bacterium]|nr:AbrB/MazE/SpoVT family DNA-binding domain-containing protein [Elusimicrobiota bacterium]
MKASVIAIGNSKGIRIPKIILEQCHIKEMVRLETRGKSIIIKPYQEEPRKGWEQVFKKMRENKDDRLIIEDCLDFDLKEWEWK